MQLADHLGDDLTDYTYTILNTQSVCDIAKQKNNGNCPKMKDSFTADETDDQGSQSGEYSFDDNNLKRVL